MLDRAAAVLATMFLAYCVRRGWLGESDAAQLSPAIILLPSLAWGWWNNRNKALLQSAATVRGANGEKTVVIAPPELAHATTEKNIISTGSSTIAIADAVSDAKTKPSNFGGSI